MQAASSAAKAEWAPAPDTRWLTNDTPLGQAELSVGGGGAAWVPKLQGVPSQITKSKVG